MEDEFNLKTRFRLTKPLDSFSLGKIFDDIDKELLKKIRDGGKCEITDYSVEDATIRIDLRTTGSVRAHNVIVRLVKALKQKLGKGYKIGVRDFKIPEYVFAFDVEKEPTAEIKLPKEIVEKVEFEKNRCKITIKDLSETALQKNWVDRIMTLVRDKVAQQYFGGKAEHHEIIYKSPQREMAWNKDPTEEMLKANWVARAPGEGQWLYGPPAAKLVSAMHRIAKREVIDKLDFKEMIIPKVTTWETWKRSGHAKGIYPSIYYVCPPKTAEPEFWEDVADYFIITGDIHSKAIVEKIGAPIGGVTFAQCPPFWPYLQGKTIDKDDFPIMVFDRSGTSMRYEGGGKHGIERVNEFHRIELIWLGTPEQVSEIRDKLVERYKEVFNDILEIEWRMAWVTPWFMAQEGKDGKLIDPDKKEVGTIDFEAYMPYRGDRNSEWLEFQNVSNNGHKYPVAFNVKSQTGEELYSGCSGIGLERWIAVFLAQKGMDPEEWPEKFKDYLGRRPLPKPIRFK